MVFIIVWAVVWLFLMAHVYARGTVQAKENTDPDSKDKLLFYGEVILTQQQFYENWVFLFGYLWINAFIGACNMFIIASAACIWYFSPRDPESDGDKLVTKAVSRSVWRCFCNHLGTLAFGSFLLATVQLAQMIMKYVEEQAKKGGKNKVVIYMIKACQCCLMCFERIIKFINKNAYI